MVLGGSGSARQIAKDFAEVVSTVLYHPGYVLCGGICCWLYLGKGVGVGVDMYYGMGCDIYCIVCTEYVCMYVCMWARLD